jgi:hypothetical protein
VSTPPSSPTIVPPEELVELFGLAEDEAERVSALVQLSIEAYCWPGVIPDPVPPPVHAAGLTLAARFSGAALTKAGAVLSETLGSYSYRLASPLTFDQVMELAATVGDALAPWAPRHVTAYTIDTYPSSWGDWPVDWWQRDLDRINGELVDQDVELDPAGGFA